MSRLSVSEDHRLPDHLRTISSRFGARQAKCAERPATTLKVGSAAGLRRPEAHQGDEIRQLFETIHWDEVIRGETPYQDLSSW